MIDFHDSGAGHSRTSRPAVLPALAILAALAVAPSSSVLAASAGKADSAAAAGGALTAQSRPDPATVAKLQSRSQSAPVRVILEFALGGAGAKSHRPEATLSAAEASAQRQAIARVGNDVLARLGATDYGDVRTFETLPLIALEVGPDALQELANDPAVLRIQEDVAVPPYLADSVPLIGADDVWADGFTGAGIAVAILDTGVDADHPFLTGKVVAEACFSSNTANATSLCPGGVTESTAAGSGRNCPAAVSGCNHGTHVAGIAAGTRQDFSGVARGGQLIAIQVFSRFTGTDCTNLGLTSPCALTFGSDQIRALERVAALSSTLDIAAANMSLGGGAFASPCDNDLLKLPIDNLRAAGIATVIASGNDGFNGMVGAPGCISTAITVGSSTKADAVSDFSNHASLVDVIAPGSSINSSVPGTGFAQFNGTSMATPHVAGAFALLHDGDDAATVDQIEAALESTGVPLSRAGITLPRIQVDAALAALLGAGGRPLNDDFRDAVTLSGLEGSTNGSNVNATAQQGEPTHAGVGGGKSVWWLWEAPTSGTATLSTFGSDYDTVLAVYEGSQVAQLTEVASNDDVAGLLQSAVEFAATSGTTYRIAVDGYQGAEGNIVLNFELSADGAGGNDRLGQAIRLEGPVGVTTGSNVGATAQQGEPVHAGVGGGKSVWWRWRPAASGDTVISTVGSSFDTVLAVYRGRRIGALTEVASNDDGAGLGLQSLVRFAAEEGVNYAIAVDGFEGAEGDISLLFANLAALPAAGAAVADAPEDQAGWLALARRAVAD